MCGWAMFMDQNTGKEGLNPETVSGAGTEWNICINIYNMNIF